MRKRGSFKEDSLRSLTQGDESCGNSLELSESASHVNAFFHIQSQEHWGCQVLCWEIS